MNTAENIKELHDGGYISQAYKMAENESVAIEQDYGKETTMFEFSDGSQITFHHLDCEISEAQS